MSASFAIILFEIRSTISWLFQPRTASSPHFLSSNFFFFTAYRHWIWRQSHALSFQNLICFCYLAVNKHVPSLHLKYFLWKNCLIYSKLTTRWYLRIRCFLNCGMKAALLWSSQEFCYLQTIDDNFISSTQLQRNTAVRVHGLSFSTEACKSSTSCRQKLIIRDVDMPSRIKFASLKFLLKTALRRLRNRKKSRLQIRRKFWFYKMKSTSLCMLGRFCHFHI